MKKKYYDTTQNVKQKARAKRLAERNQALVLGAKAKPCTDCGGTYPFFVMDLDHLDGKKFSLGRAGCRSVENVKVEIAKCQPVCANCHRVRTYNRAHVDQRQSQQT